MSQQFFDRRYFVLQRRKLRPYAFGCPELIDKKLKQIGRDL